MSYNPQSKYIHRDLHSGNVLLDSNFKCLIGDLGLSQPSQPTNKKLDNEIYGVIPYVAPEILSGKLVSQGSDIYSMAEQKRLKLISLEKLGPEFSEKPHPKAIYTSRPLRSLISKVSSINTTSSESSNTGM
ncbi:14800_t:CDS:2 [Funneliformis geosporum]|uniref:14800_t:CDS:1 n=1 Tax=Funneliformis geosporum TaxID=1117311 RepID=A0A9W4SCL8_9GLOM|nr:14800_t:CDS:2 [Funneliformis geosporum]